MTIRKVNSNDYKFGRYGIYLKEGDKVIHKDYERTGIVTGLFNSGKSIMVNVNLDIGNKVQVRARKLKKIDSKLGYKVRNV